MIYPNAEAANFCDWMLNFSAEKLTGPQKSLVQYVQAQALAAGTVTTTQWYNFQNFTAWRFPIFEVFRNCQSLQYPSATNTTLAAWLQALSAAGYAAPSVTLLNRLNTALTYATVQDIISKIDYLFYGAGEIIEQCFIPLISSSGNTITPVGNNTFSPGIGIKSDGASYLKSGWNQSTDAINFLQDNATIAANLSYNNTVATECAAGVINFTGNNTSIFPFAIATTIYLSINANTPLITNLPSVEGPIIAQRTAPNLILFTESGSLLNSGNQPFVSIPNAEHFILAANNAGAATFFYQNFISAYLLGSGSINPFLLSTFFNLLIQ